MESRYFKVAQEYRRPLRLCFEIDKMEEVFSCFEIMKNGVIDNRLIVFFREGIL